MPEQDPGLQLTDNAIQYLKRALNKKIEPKPSGIRVNVKKAGCTGYEYQIEYAYPETQNVLDFVFEFENMLVIIDKEIYLKFFKGGTVMDFRREGINEGLHFDNPNVGHQCGCGESFTLHENP